VLYIRTEGVIIDNKKYSCYTRLPFRLFSHNVRLLRGSSVFILCSSAFGLHSGLTNNSTWRGAVALLAQRGHPLNYSAMEWPLSATTCSYSCSSVAPLSLARHGRPAGHSLARQSRVIAWKGFSDKRDSSRQPRVFHSFRVRMFKFLHHANSMTGEARP